VAARYLSNAAHAQGGKFENHIGGEIKISAQPLRVPACAICAAFVGVYLRELPGRGERGSSVESAYPSTTKSMIRGFLSRFKTPCSVFAPQTLSRTSFDCVCFSQQTGILISVR
jgi:hypothetical protein